MRIYGKNDLRLETFELPEIGDDELLVKIGIGTEAMVKVGDFDWRLTVGQDMRQQHAINSTADRKEELIFWHALGE